MYVVRNIFPKFVRTYRTCMHHDKSFLNTCIVPPYRFLTRLCNSYPLWLCLTRVAYVVGTDGSTGWKWEFPVDVWNSCSFLESLALCGVLWTAPLSLEWSIPRGTAMVWSVANHTSSYTSTLLVGMEGGIQRKNSLGGCPSSGFWGAESDLSAARGWAYRQCR